MRNAAGYIYCALSPWSPFRLTEGSAPWAFGKGLPSRSFAALNAAGVLVALFPFQSHLRLSSHQWYPMPGIADDKDNQYTTSRLPTARFPLGAVLMKIAARSEALRLRLAMDWVPRKLGAEEDRLAGGSLHGLQPIAQT